MARGPGLIQPLWGKYYKNRVTRSVECATYSWSSETHSSECAPYWEDKLTLWERGVGVQGWEAHVLLLSSCLVTLYAGCRPSPFLGSRVCSPHPQACLPISSPPFGVERSRLSDPSRRKNSGMKDHSSGLDCLWEAGPAAMNPGETFSDQNRVIGDSWVLRASCLPGPLGVAVHPLPGGHSLWVPALIQAQEPSDACPMLQVIEVPQE